MIVEIYGAGFRNKGAQLMLWTVAERLRAEFPGVVPCVEPQYDRPYESRARYGLYTLLPFPSRRQPMLRRILRRLFDATASGGLGRRLQSYGLVSRHHCDALIDISGYSFGDKWPLSKTQQFIERAEFYVRRNKPVIMLPQMFGPFEKPGYREAMKRLFDMVTLAYAREQASYHHVRQLGVGEDKLKLAPDITIFSSPANDEARMAEASNYVCLVPNIRMLDQGKQEWGDKYMELMVQAATTVMARGLKVYVLIHEAEGKDAELAGELVKRVGHDQCEIFEEPDPLLLKQFIGRSRFLVGSRFHSIVGAFSSGVPALIMGWAHKYKMLAEDFGVSELFLGSDITSGEFGQKVDDLLSESGRSNCVTRIINARKSMVAPNREMWGRVFECLQGRASGLVRQ